MNNISITDPKSHSENVYIQPFCVGQATVSMVHMLGQHSFAPPRAVVVPIEEPDVNPVQNVRNCDLSTQNSKEERQFEGKVSFNLHCSVMISFETCMNVTHLVN